MSNNQFTGSESVRFNQLQNFWLTYEPISDHNSAVLSNLFTVPLGQTRAPSVSVNSGSVASVTGAITIEKEIHIFADETEAYRFLTDLGPENVASYTEVEVTDAIEGTRKLIEMHVINYSSFKLIFDLLDANLAKGFIVETFLSGSPFDSAGARVDLEPVTRKIIYDSRNRVISDTYLRFFNIESDEMPSSSEEQIFGEPAPDDGGPEIEGSE